MPAAAASQPTPAPAPAVDPVAELIARADAHVEAGRQELSLGHLERAKAAFNQAVAVVLEAPEPVRTGSRVREHFDRMVDRISALELTALAAGDGFTEQRLEPASIDELLAVTTFGIPEVTARTTEAVEADLLQKNHDIPIPLNERVLRYVELFQGNLRDFLTQGLIRGTQYLPMIQDVFRAEGLPLDLAYVPLIESAFKPTALSKAKAKGVWQFMHGTGLENGLKADWYVDERSDPYKSTRAAAKYLKTLYRMFENWHLALASYNGGPGRVQRAIRSSARNDFWTLTDSSRWLPRETREYVPMILAATIIAKNPAQYGFHVATTPVPATEQVEVKGAVDLRRIAEWAGTPVDDIQRLNPELRRWTTPLRADGYSVTVPSGTAALVRSGLRDATTPSLNALQWYTVKRGETLTTIARKLRVSRSDLAEANYLRATAPVKVGQRLVIPRMPSAALLARAAAGIPGVETELEVAVDDLVAEGSSTGPVVYRVRRGDTLSSIARRHGTTVDRIRAANKLRGESIAVGARLVIPATAANTQQ